MRFLAIFLSLVCWIDLILHLVIVLDVYQLSPMLPGQAGSFKSHKKSFLNESKCQKEVLADFLSLVCWIDSILHIVIVLNVYQLLAMLPGQAGSFKNQKNAFLNDPKCQNGGFWPLSGVWCVGST